MKLMKTKSFLATLRDDVVMADAFGKNKAGNVVIRQGYFYRHGQTPEIFKARVEAQCKSAGVAIRIVGCGDHWAAFRGGASIARSSHFWVEVAAVSDFHFESSPA